MSFGGCELNDIELTALNRLRIWFDQQWVLSLIY